MVRSIKAYAILKNNKLNANEIYSDKDVMLCKGEKLIRVIISCEKNFFKKKK